MEVITAHTNADFDTLAAMLAAKKLYPAARVAFPGSLEKELRVALKTLRLPFKIERAKDIDLSKITRLILVDTRSPERIGRFKEILTKKGLDIIAFDHHPDQSEDVSVNGGAVRAYGSTTTILTLILKEKNLDITPEEATIMIAGIYEDTGSLGFASTKVEDFDAARHLLEKGARLDKATALLRHDLTAIEVNALHDLIISEARYTVGGVEVIIASVSVEDYHGEVAELASRLTQIERPHCLVLLAQSIDRVHFVIRSSCKDIHAGLLAKRLGGGGHAEAASATIKGLTLIQAKERALKELTAVTIPKTTARHIMSAPVITIKSTSTLSNAALKMRRFNINAMPVVSGRGRLEGVVTRQVVDKAIGHGLGKELTKDYLSNDILTIEASSSTDEVRRLVPELGQRLLPVMEKDRLVGVITRTDLIKILSAGLRETQEGKSEKNRNVSSLLRGQLPQWVVTLLRDAGATAQKLDCKAFCVGGFVRDLLMRRDNLDIDIVIEGDGIRFAKELAKKLKAKVRTHERFKTAVITLPDGTKIDIATTRLEYYEKPGALPTIELSSLKLDLYRRDFTINTLAISLNPLSFGNLLDFFDAERDIKLRFIRVLHNLSFVEDPTRAMRAVRFSERFDFKIAPHTENLLKNSVKLELLKKTSASRVRLEFISVLGEAMAQRAVGRMNELKLLALINEKIQWDAKTKRLFENATKVVAWYGLCGREDKIEQWFVLLLAITSNLNKRELTAFSKRLKIDNKKNLATINGRSEGLRALRIIGAARAPSASRIFKLLHPLTLETTLYLIAKTNKPNVKKLISRYITELKDLKPRLKGKDLLTLGVKQGPEVGRILDKLLIATLDGKVSSLQSERKFVKELIKNDR
jgi:tRNA nucleotidyltransferase (CCA-adding enzyme)